MNWDALKSTAAELGLGALVPDVNPVEFEEDGETGEGQQQREEGEDTDMEVEADESGAKKETVDEETLKKLHTLLLETAVTEGKLCCANCGFEYPIKDGVGNFLLPAHLV